MDGASSTSIGVPNAVFLVGFMGCGKTTVGLGLAQRMAWKFIDLDQRIEQEERMSIAEIFARAGEVAFRKKEHELLRQLVQETPPTGGRVVALGGGTFAQPQNFQLLQDCKAITIWLECPVEELLSRCALVTNRPLFRDAASFRRLYEQRLPYYQQAAFAVHTGQADPNAVISEILSLLALRGFPCRR